MNCVVTERKELDKIAGTSGIEKLIASLCKLQTNKILDKQPSQRHAKCNGYSKFCIGGAGILRLNRPTTKVAITS